MHKSSSFRFYQVLHTVFVMTCILAVTLFAGCDTNYSPQPVNPPIDQSPSNPKSDVFISGRVTFDFVPHRQTNSALNYLATEQRPGRGLTVQLLDKNGQLLRETRSDANGDYQLGSPANTTVRVRVVAELERKDTANWQIRVADNTDDNAIYTMSGSLTNSGANNSIRNLHAASGWVDDEYNEERVAAPFAILDAVYDALTLLESADATVSLAPAQIRWSVNNKSVNGNANVGEIGTSYFNPGLGHIYILGWADNDTDEYDRSVILHEFGHLIEHQLFRSDNIGGDHSPNERLDIRVAFSEGWGNAFSAMASQDPTYRDSFGSNQDLGFSFSSEDIETINPGWFSEGSVSNIIYDIFDDTSEANDTINAGFAPIYQALTSSSFVNSDALIGQHVFNEAILNFLNVSQQTEFLNLLADHQIFGQDAFALSETNTGGNPDALPLFLPISLGGTVQVCTNNILGEWNKLGNRRFLYVNLPNTSTRTVSISISTSGRGGDQADAWIDVFHRGEYLKSLNLTTYNVDSETFTPDEAGIHVLEYYEADNTDEDDNTGGAYCANITIN